MLCHACHAIPSPVAAVPAGRLRHRARAADQPDGPDEHHVPDPRGSSAGELAAVGSGGVRARRPARPTRAAVRGGGRLPLVRADGPRGVCRPDAGRADRFAVRAGAAGPRRATRYRAALRGGRAVARGTARLPAHRVPHARRRAVLRGHLLSRRRPGHRPGAEADPAGHRQELPGAAPVHPPACGGGAPAGHHQGRHHARRAERGRGRARDRQRASRRRGAGATPRGPGRVCAHAGRRPAARRLRAGSGHGRAHRGPSGA